MKHLITGSLVVVGSVALLVGCGNKNNDGLHGTSTRRAEVPAQPAQPVQAAQPVQPAQPVQAVPAAPAGYTAFGESMRLMDRDAVPVGQVLADPAKYEGTYLRITGDVSKVCTRKGCWLEMADAQSRKPLFVKFTCPVEGRLIPMAAVGKPVVVEGTVNVKEISEDDARHLKEESGATPEEVAAIKGPQKQITIESPAARVAGL